MCKSLGYLNDRVHGFLSWIRQIFSASRCPGDKLIEIKALVAQLPQLDHNLNYVWVLLSMSFSFYVWVQKLTLNVSFLYEINDCQLGQNPRCVLSLFQDRSQKFDQNILIYASNLPILDYPRDCVSVKFICESWFKIELIDQCDCFSYVNFTVRNFKDWG